jgi:hypothetical protein
MTTKSRCNHLALFILCLGLPVFKLAEFIVFGFWPHTGYDAFTASYLPLNMLAFRLVRCLGEKVFKPPHSPGAIYAMAIVICFLLEVEPPILSAFRAKPDESSRIATSRLELFLKILMEGFARMRYVDVHLKGNGTLESPFAKETLTIPGRTAADYSLAFATA